MSDVPVNSSMTFTDINNAVIAANLDDNIVFAPGTYNLTGSLQISKRVNFIGAGEGSNPAVDTIIDMGGGAVARTIMVLAVGEVGNPIEIRNMRLQNAPSAMGIYMLNLSHVLIEDMYISGHNHGIEFHLGSISNVTCRRVTTYDCYIGVKNAATMVSDSLFEDCHFDDGTYGTYIDSDMSGATFNSCSFNRNGHKGMLIYYASDLLVDNCQIIDSGNNHGDSKPGGIDLGLKTGTHSNIAFTGMIIDNCGGGAYGNGFGAWLRARSDGYSGTATGITFSGDIRNCPVDALKIGMADVTPKTFDVDVSNTFFSGNAAQAVLKDLRDATTTDVLSAQNCFWGQSGVPYGVKTGTGTPLVDPDTGLTTLVTGIGFETAVEDVIKFDPWSTTDRYALPDVPVRRDLSLGIPGGGDDSDSGQGTYEQAYWEGKQAFHGIDGKIKTIKAYGDALLPSTSTNTGNPSQGTGLITNWDDRNNPL